METITFEHLKKKLGIGLAVAICQEMLSEEFFNALQINDWIEIYQEAKPGSDLEQRALKIIKECFRKNIRSPMVGTFAASGQWPSTSDMELLVKAGDHVEPDTVVCGVEAMMVQNEIKAGVRGTITEVLAKDGQAVDYDEVLFIVKPDM